MDTRAIKEKIAKREIDINNIENFFSILLKGFLSDLSSKIKVRGKIVPHIVLNTGDDTMFVNVKGYNYEKDTLEVTNEDYIYTTVPRAMVVFNGITLLVDQLTSQFSRGHLSIEHEDMIYGANCEFRRMPITTDVSIKYILDNFEDSLMCTQQLITSLAFINVFNITYLGQTIECSYTLPDSIDKEVMIEFDSITTDSKNRIINIDFKLESNIPIYNERTIIMNNEFISNIESKLSDGKSIIDIRNNS